MPDDPQLGPLHSLYSRMISHLALYCMGLELDLAGLIDFLARSGIADEETLRTHMEHYRDQHEVEARDKLIAMLNHDPAGPEDDLERLFGWTPPDPEP